MATKGYTVCVCGKPVKTLVTSDDTAANSWILETEQLNPNRNCPLPVGLDVQLRAPMKAHQLFDMPPSIIQLCLDSRCLIFQFRHAWLIPYRLVEFLESERCIFVGVGMDNHVRKLRDHYDLKVRNVKDLRHVAAGTYWDASLLDVGVEELAGRVLGLKENKEEKGVTVTTSVGRLGHEWDEPTLSDTGVAYACRMAKLAFRIGQILEAYKDDSESQFSFKLGSLWTQLVRSVLSLFSA